MTWCRVHFNLFTQQHRQRQQRQMVPKGDAERTAFNSTRYVISAFSALQPHYSVYYYYYLYKLITSGRCCLIVFIHLQRNRRDRNGSSGATFIYFIRINVCFCSYFHFGFRRLLEMEININWNCCVGGDRCADSCEWNTIAADKINRIARTRAKKKKKKEHRISRNTM